jgi:oligogalacturonide lyase
VDLETGEAEPLVAGSDIEEFQISLTPDDRQLYYSRGQSLCRCELATGKEDVVWTQLAPWNGDAVYPGFSADFRYALMAQMHRDDAVPRTEGWSFLEPQWRKKPRCRLVRVDLHTGAEQLVREEACWLGHPQICPGDPDTLMYCHEGGGPRGGRDVDARIWLVQADGSNNRCAGYLEPEPGKGSGELITHEAFMPDGRHFYYLRLPQAAGEKVSLRLRTVADCVLVKNLPVSGWLHAGPSPDSRYLVGDQKGEPGQGMLWLLALATGVETPLCLHGSSYRVCGRQLPTANTTQDAHPHPSFSPDGRNVLFTSDRETGQNGHCAVYVANLKQGYTP